MSTAFCLDCDRELDLGATPAVGQKMKCPHCEVELEIINLSPMELDWVYNGPVTDWGLFDEGWGLSLPVTNHT